MERTTRAEPAARPAVYDQVVMMRTRMTAAPIPQLVELAKQNEGQRDGLVALVHTLWGNAAALQVASEVGIVRPEAASTETASGGAAITPGGYVVDAAQAGPDAIAQRNQALDAVRAHAAQLPLGVVAGSIAEDMDVAHQDQINQTGTGVYQGNRTFDKTPGAVDVDCTTYIFKILEGAFAASGKSSIWTRVKAKMMAYARAKTPVSLSGVDLQRALQDEGWVGVYLTPHNFQKSSAIPKSERGSKYWGAKHDRRIHNYGHDGEIGKQVEQHLDQVPFGVFAMSSAMHMAVIVRGIVYEVHWSDSASNENVIQATSIATFLQSSWGGLLVVPKEDAPAGFDGKADERATTPEATSAPAGN